LIESLEQQGVLIKPRLKGVFPAKAAVWDTGIQIDGI